MTTTSTSFCSVVVAAGILFITGWFCFVITDNDDAIPSTTVEGIVMKRLGAPDTTCKEIYDRNPSRETCLAANDFFGRHCYYCRDGGKNENDVHCYTVDEARWAKIFGAKCESGPDF